MEQKLFGDLAPEDIKKIIEEYSASKDKQNWPDGEWKSESDEDSFEYNGYRCRIQRADTTGSLCGYVALPKDHEFSKIDYMDIDIEAHGGITYGQEDDQGVYWIGFDCAHWGDYSPKHAIIEKLSNRLFDLQSKYPHCLQERDKGSTYKNIEFVRNECRRIVDQLKIKK